MDKIILPVAIVLLRWCAFWELTRTSLGRILFCKSRGVFTLDPQRMSWLTDMQVAYCLFEGVVRWNTSDFSIEPAAAQSYDISEDGLIYTFHLRDDAKWSNGAGVTAYDFQYSWMRLLTPDTSSDYSSFFFTIKGAQTFWTWRTGKLQNKEVISLEELEQKFRGVVGIRVVNDHTITIELEYPVPYFLDQLALAVCSPVYKPAVEGWDTKSDEYKTALNLGWQNCTHPPRIRGGG